ncbi:MAG: hypothetical protein HYZ42_12025 [Bacteroidetes bacterium]|nr:hypothetical protein [Bacteroidota bacterium]
MLDFYLINEDKPKPSSPELGKLTFIGGLDTQTFDNLKKKGIIDERFEYYCDFRWGILQIKQMKQIINQKHLQVDADVFKILYILDTAEQAKCGLIAYGD